MNYIVIPSKTKSETDFLLGLLKKMHTQSRVLSSEHMEDIAFIAALKEAELSGKGSLSKAKLHLQKIASGK